MRHEAVLETESKTESVYEMLQMGQNHIGLKQMHWY